MGWTWRYETADGTEVDPPGAASVEPFATQSDAETWIGETWRDLLAFGVHQVTLLEEGREVYGPMGLNPAE